MKRIITKIFIVTFISLLFILFIPKKANASDLDRIHNYEIIVDPNFDDGSLNIRINIKWEVLDSNSEGPLEWVKIGVPNYHVSNLTSLTSNIKEIKYYASSGAFIRLDFNKSYYAGDIVDFSFSFNQSYMYHIDNDYIVYDYSPGYFKDILVDNCVLKWNTKNVLENNTKENSRITTSNLDGYNIYEAKLDYKETIEVNYTYNKSSFIEIDESKTYTDKYEDDSILPIILVFVSIAITIIIVVILSYVKSDPYKTNRGFYMPTNWNHFMHGRRYYNPSSGMSSKGRPINPTSVGGSGHHSSCACACACAGGGRAGCSFKDFYHTNIKSSDLEKVIKEDK